MKLQIHWRDESFFCYNSEKNDESSILNPWQQKNDKNLHFHKLSEPFPTSRLPKGMQMQVNITSNWNK